MKKPFLILIILAIPDCKQNFNNEIKSEISFSKAKAGRSIYSNKGILIPEITRRIISKFIVFPLDITYPIG